MALVTLYNTSLWTFVFSVWEGRGVGDYLFLASMGAVLAVAFTLVFLLFSSSHIVKPALAIIIIFASVTSYFSTNYGVVFDKAMIMNVVETNLGEARDFFSLSLVVHIVLFGILPSWLILAVPLKVFALRKEAIIRLVTVIGCLVFISLTAATFYQEYASFVRNNRQFRHVINPSSPIYYSFSALTSYLWEDNKVYREVATSVSRENTVDDRPIVLVFVLGETARANRFSLNGYGRETNPELAALPIINFGAVTSCGTSTATSVPCLFSSRARAEFSVSEEKQTENLLDILVRADFDVLWLENNTGCKGVCDRVPTERMSQREENASLCSTDGCRDDVLVETLQAKLRSITRDTVIVMHQIGSHGPAYYKRYPDTFRRFVPTCDTPQLQLCSREQISNSYDNTILYTDHIIAAIIGELENTSDRVDASMLYISDHGESLGEMGMYLHGMPYAFSPDVQREVPMIFWTAPAFRDRLSIDSECMKHNAGATLSHDNIFHTVLGMLDVKTDVYDETLDFVVGCRSPEREATSITAVPPASSAE